MGLKKAENQVKIMLADTIMAMCRNTLNYHGEVCVEGLIGITLDKEEIFLVSINQTITNPEVLKQKAESEGSKSQNDRKRRSTDDESSESESSDSQSDSENKQKKARRKRRKRKTSSQSSGSSGESDGENEKKSKDLDTSGEQAHGDIDNTSVISANSNSMIPTLPPGQFVSVKNEKTDDDDELMIMKEEGLDSNSSVSQQYSDLVAGAAQFPPFNQFNLSGSDGSTPFHNTSLQFLASQQMSPDGSVPQPGPSHQGLVPHPMMIQHMMAAAGQLNQSLMTSQSSLMTSPMKSPSPRRQHENHGDRAKNRTCSLCSKVLPSKSHLTLHMRVHTGERPHKCLVCSKAFTQKGALKRHIDTVHSDMSLPVDSDMSLPVDSDMSLPVDSDMSLPVDSDMSLPVDSDLTLPDENKEPEGLQ